MLLHIISDDDFSAARASGCIAPSSLHTEGFVHCSYPEQVLTPANERFRGQNNLVLLSLAPARVQPRLLVEDSYGSGVSFPHVYGPIPVGAVEDVIEFPCEPDGSFVLPSRVLAQVCSVWESAAEELSIRIDYFHANTDQQLEMMGVDRDLLPERDTWLLDAQADLSLPLERRDTVSLVWLLGDSVVGFSTANRIVVGEQAFMHFHLIDRSNRGRGLGARFVRLSAAHYVTALRLQRLYSEPKALNIAANRTLQSAGFKYEFSHHVPPGPINEPQIASRWVLDS